MAAAKPCFYVIWYLIFVKNAFSRIYSRSPSVEVYNTWKPVKYYIQDTIKPNDRETYYFDSYDPSELEAVIKTQQQVVDYQRYQKHGDLYHILIVIGDFADGTSFTRKSQLLHQLYIYIYIYIRGRHYMISTFASTQVYQRISPIVRKSMTHVFTYRLRNYGDLESIIAEMGAIYDRHI